MAFMAQRYKRGLITASGFLVLALAIFGCAVGGGSSGGGGTTGGPTATPAPPRHALAWFQTSGSSVDAVGDLWASVNDGAAHQVTHTVSQHQECNYQIHWGQPTFSPNLTHILAAQGSAACTDGDEHGKLYVVDATSGATSEVPGADIRLTVHQSGWLDNNTIWWSDFRQVHTYTLGGGSSTVIGAIGTSSGSSYTGGGESELRGNTLFYVTESQSTSSGPLTYALKRFDMTTHAVLGGSIALGSVTPCECSRGDMTGPGFDASPDGTHVAFQRVAGGIDAGITSQFFHAAADGSGESRIARYATAHAFTSMQISPNGRLVAVTGATPAPSTFTASVTSPGASGDPDLHFYTSDASSYPVWKYDSSGYYASTKGVDVYPPDPSGDILSFTVGTATGATAFSGGVNPWYTIGH
jgi:hypothetical protein